MYNNSKLQMYEDYSNEYGNYKNNMFFIINYYFILKINDVLIPPNAKLLENEMPKKLYNIKF